MELVVEKRVEFKEDTYADWLINDLYDMLEDEQGDDWKSLSEDQQIEFAISTFETAIKMMKGER